MSTERIDKVKELLNDVEAAYQDAAASGKSAPGIAALARESGAPAGFIDAAGVLPEAEVLFVIREEMPKTLTDIVFRRMMIGLDADQGRPHYARIAGLAAAEFGWDGARQNVELRSLQDYAQSLRFD